MISTGMYIYLYKNLKQRLHHLLLKGINKYIIDRDDGEEKN
jgi:hypothetical protein